MKTRQNHQKAVFGAVLLIGVAGVAADALATIYYNQNRTTCWSCWSSSPGCAEGSEGVRNSGTCGNGIRINSCYYDSVGGWVVDCPNGGGGGGDPCLGCPIEPEG